MVDREILATRLGRLREALRKLEGIAQEGVIPRDLAENLSRAVGLRNRLVHGYSTIDHAFLHGILGTDLRDLADFATALSQRYGGGAG